MYNINIIMDYFDLDKIDWYNKETRELYERINKSFIKIATKKIPEIVKIKIDPNSFNNVVREMNEEARTFRWGYNVSVHICIDYTISRIDAIRLVTGTQSVLKDVSEMMGSELLQNGYLLQSYEMNKSLFCQGLIKYTTDRA